MSDTQPLPMKAYPILNSSTLPYLEVLGEVFSTIDHPSTAISAVPDTEDPMASGELTDVWSGAKGSEKVAIKAFHANPGASAAAAKEVQISRAPDCLTLKPIWQFVQKKASVWKRLNHPNVLKFEGMGSSARGKLALVYGWAPENIVDHVKLSPDVTLRPQLVLFFLLNLPNRLTIFGW